MRCSLDHALGRNTTSFSVQLVVSMRPVMIRVLAKNKDKQTPLKRGGRGGQPGVPSSDSWEPTPRTQPAYLDVLHELPHVAVPVRGHIAVGLHVQHRPVALPPPRLLLGQGHGRGPQVRDAGQPLQRERVVGLPAEGGRVVEEPDAGRVREHVVVHGGLLVEERPGLVGQAGQRRLVRPEVGAVEDERLGAAVPGHPPAPGDEAGAAGAVDALRVAGEVREEAPAPPEQDGQRLVAPRVVVAGPAVRRGGDEGRARRDGVLRPAMRPAGLGRLLGGRSHPRAAGQRQRHPQARGPRPGTPHAQPATPGLPRARPAAPGRSPGPAPVVPSRGRAGPGTALAARTVPLQRRSGQRFGAPLRRQREPCCSRSTR